MTPAQPARAAPLVEFTPAALASAVEGNVIELWRTCCSHLPGATFHEDAEVVWFTTGNTFAPWLNQVLVARFGDDGLDIRIERALAPFKERRLPMLWSVGPSTGPAALGAHLERHGLVLANAMPGMAVDLGDIGDVPMTPGFHVQPVDGDETLRTWADAYVRGFEMEEVAGRVLLDAYERIGFGNAAPVRHFVGLLDGEPVASSTLFLGAGVAGIWHVGTLPGARRRGIGAAMTLAPLRVARALGYRAGTLYASSMGASVYRRLGFREYGRMEQYGWSPASTLDPGGRR